MVMEPEKRMNLMRILAFVALLIGSYWLLSFVEFASDCVEAQVFTVLSVFLIAIAFKIRDDVRSLVPPKYAWNGRLYQCYLILLLLFILYLVASRLYDGCV